MANILDETGIQNFYKKAQETDFARDFQFRLIQIGDLSVDRELSDRRVFMTATTLPNRQINNQSVPYMGLSFNVPGSVSYPGSDGWAVTFRCPQDYSVRQTLEKWQTAIFSVISSTGEYAVPREDQVIEIGLINNHGDIIRQYKLIGVYPISLGDMAFNLTGSGAPVEFSATLAYQFWVNTLQTNVSSSAGPSNIMNFAQDESSGLALGTPNILG